MGIEPTFEAWEAPVLPLNYTREFLTRQQFTEERESVSPPDGRGMVMIGVEGSVMLDGGRVLLPCGGLENTKLP